MRKAWTRALAIAGAALLTWGCAGSEAPAPAANPVPAVPTFPVGEVTGNPIFAAADPHALVHGDRYWIYATSPRALSDPDRPRLYAWSSPDLRRWTRSEPIFSFEGVDWIDDDGVERHGLWAPAVIERGGLWFLYYSVGPQNPTPSRLGVAVGSGPTGPFRDSGRPLFTGGNGFEAIDPMVFTDPRTGTSYLYAGGSAGATLRVWELAPDMVSFAREVPVDQPPRFTEGPFMHERNGIYYLSYSFGNWDRATYSAHYATAPGPTGPWTYRGAILTSDATRKGPGHHSIVRNPRTDEWFIVYHRWERTDDGPYQGDRQIAVQRLEYNADGTLRPIAMTDEPPPVSPIAGAGAPQSGISDRRSPLSTPASSTAMTSAASFAEIGFGPSPARAAATAR